MTIIILFFFIIIYEMIITYLACKYLRLTCAFRFLIDRIYRLSGMEYSNLASFYKMIVLEIIIIIKYNI